MRLSFTIAAGPRQHSLSEVQVPLSRIRDYPNLEGRVPVLIVLRNRVAHLYPRLRVPFSSFPTTRTARVEVFEPASKRGARMPEGTEENHRRAETGHRLSGPRLELGTSCDVR
jgi:hypothetical protein